MKPYSELTVGLYGYGRSNAGVMNYLCSLGCRSFILRSDTECRVPSGIDRAYFGSNALRDLREDVIYLSPSVRRDRPQLSDAARRGVHLSSDAELFFEHTDAEVYTVTGSAGKSTTTHLIAQVLNRCGKVAVAAGNYGVSLSSLLGKVATVVAELSSFQLTYMRPTSVRAVITNISPNHLDWHTSMEEYVGAKLGIAVNSDGLICDADSDILISSLDAPVHAAVSSKMSHKELRDRMTANHYLTLDETVIVVDGEKYTDLAGAPRCEEHNVKNMLLAAAATLDVANADACRDAFLGFYGLSHRAQLVAECGGVRYVNSSIDTSPDRVIATLSAASERTVAIICGKSKGLDYSRLAAVLPKLTVGAVLMGAVGSEIAELIYDNAYRYAACDSMDDAVAYATDILAGKGDVILCPGGTSFDRYASFEERGTDFCRAVENYIKNKDDKK